MEKKLVYESPKVSKLDDRDSLLGGEMDKCEVGSGDVNMCASGNNAAGECFQTGSNPLDPDGT